MVKIVSLPWNMFNNIRIVKPKLSLLPWVWRTLQAKIALKHHATSSYIFVDKVHILWLWMALELQWKITPHCALIIFHRYFSLMHVMFECCVWAFCVSCSVLLGHSLVPFNRVIPLHFGLLGVCLYYTLYYLREV